MSKAELRKAIAGFEAPELRQIILDLYSKSREAKEILDFFANPDPKKKADEYMEAILKEVNRTRHRLPAMRIREIRSIIKKFERLQPGDDAVASMMAEAFLLICRYGSIYYIEDEKINQLDPFFTDTINRLRRTRLFEEYNPRLRKGVMSISSNAYVRSHLAGLLDKGQNSEICRGEEIFL